MLKKVLIVDDDEVNRDLVSKALKHEGYELFEAKDGFQAVILSQGIRPDLIILDIMMPGKSDYNVCEEVKKTKSTETIPVLFLSARFSAATRKTAQTMGGDGYIAKPLSAPELRTSVRNLLKIESKDTRTNVPTS